MLKGMEWTARTESDEVKIPKGANAVYVRVDENKLYWVKGKETGDVDIWD